MMDRFANDEIEVGIEERPGCKFIMCSQQIYLKLNKLHLKYVKIDHEMRSLYDAIDDLIRSYNAYEKQREKFMVPTWLHDDYVEAQKRYQSIRKNPEAYYNSEEAKRQALTKERENLVNKIKNLEGELAHNEDQANLDILNSENRLTTELADLKTKKKKYDTQEAAAGKNYFPMCAANHKEKVDKVTSRIGTVEIELKNLGKRRNSLIEEMNTKLNDMNNRRWEIDNELIALENTPRLRMTRWQAAIDKAEIAANVCRLDIEAAVTSHYGSYTQQPMHAFINVYGWAMACVKKLGTNTDVIKDELSRMPLLADSIYCPELVNRSVETLYRKLKSLSEIDRNNIISKKPTMNHLPEELLRTFAVSHLRDSTDLMKMFNDAFPSNPLVSIPRLKK